MFFVLSRAWTKEKTLSPHEANEPKTLYFLEHWSAESEGLRFDSSWGLRIFPSYHARDKAKNISLYKCLSSGFLQYELPQLDFSLWHCFTHIWQASRESCGMSVSSLAYFLVPNLLNTFC